MLEGTLATRADCEYYTTLSGLVSMLFLAKFKETGEIVESENGKILLQLRIIIYIG